jgi:hypothetical protein
MSKTKGHMKSQRQNKISANKMKPYVGDKDIGKGKFVVEASTGNPHGNGSGFKNGISKMGKLITKNANRSRKKSARQQYKNEIRVCTKK